MKRAFVVMGMLLVLGIILFAGKRVMVSSSNHDVCSVSTLRRAQGDTLVCLTDPSERQRRMIVVEVADTPEERSLGLMGRMSLQEGSGMLFSFDEPQALSFWMKNTLLPLDILFFDALGSFVSRTSMGPCLSDPCSSYWSAAPAQYALEVNRGEPEVEGVGEGWRMGIGD